MKYLLLSLFLLAGCTRSEIRKEVETKSYTDVIRYVEFLQESHGVHYIFFFTDTDVLKVRCSFDTPVDFEFDVPVKITYYEDSLFLISIEDANK